MAEDLSLADDLLALAGDDEPVAEQDAVTHNSPSPPPKASSPPDQEPGMPAKGVARKAPKVRGAASKSRSTRIDFSDEEEEEECVLHIPDYVSYRF